MQNADNVKFEQATKQYESTSDERKQKIIAQNMIDLDSLEMMMMIHVHGSFLLLIASRAVYSFATQSEALVSLDPTTNVHSIGQ